MINKSQLIFIYSVVLVFLISIGLTYLNPLFCILTLISAGFLSGFLANQTFFNIDNKDYPDPKYPITEGNTLSNVRTNFDRQMPSDPPPSLSKKEEEMNEDNFIELSAPVSLKDLTREAEDYCEELGVEYNPRKIMISTDYGTKVVLWYDNNEEK